MFNFSYSSGSSVYKHNILTSGLVYVDTFIEGVTPRDAVACMDEFFLHIFEYMNNLVYLSYLIIDKKKLLYSAEIIYFSPSHRLKNIYKCCF